MHTYRLTRQSLASSLVARRTRRLVALALIVAALGGAVAGDLSGIVSATDIAPADTYGYYWRP